MTTDHPDTNPDPRLSAMLDRLADADRAAAPADLEHRVLTSTRAHLVGEPPAPVVARIGFHRRPAFRLAAAVAVIAGAALVALPVLRSGGPAASDPYASVPTDELIAGIEAGLAEWEAEATTTPAPEPMADDLASLSGELADAESILVDFWSLDDPLLSDLSGFGQEESL